MNSGLLKTLCIISVAGFMQTTPVRCQESTAGDLVRYINSRLSHSSIESIDEAGAVVIKTPDETLRFNIQETSFNYNGLNGDNRVRIFCNYCIGRYTGRSLEGTSHRESFLCRSGNDAVEVIGAFNRLKQAYADRDSRFKVFDQRITTADSSLPYSSVKGAVDFVNQHLVISAIVNVNEQGKMLINAPDDVYEVDLRKAEFGFNDLNSEPKLRIYGEWCIVVLRKDHAKELPRESFQIAGRDGALNVVKAMYFIKSAFTGMDAATVANLRNVTGRKTTSYSTIAQAVDYINDRLAYSIILRIDDNGMATVNSMEKIFIFDVRAGAFSQDDDRSLLKNIINIFSGGDRAVRVESVDGINGYEGGKSDERMDEQSFQCKSESDVKDVIKAFDFVKSKIKS